MLLGALAVSSCGLLDTPEYPDGDFTIVGTWEYHVPALEGSSPNEGQVYNAEGQITFTTDKRFCFTLSTSGGIEVDGLPFIVIYTSFSTNKSAFSKIPRVHSNPHACLFPRE